MSEEEGGVKYISLCGRCLKVGNRVYRYCTACMETIQPQVDENGYLPSGVQAQVQTVRVGPLNQNLFVHPRLIAWLARQGEDVTSIIPHEELDLECQYLQQGKTLRSEGWSADELPWPQDLHRRIFILLNWGVAQFRLEFARWFEKYINDYQSEYEGRDQD